MPHDAAGVRAVLQTIVAERIYSAIDRPWSVDEQRRYLETLSEREAVHVAVAGDGDDLIGYQTLDRYSSLLPSTAHVAQLGTFIVPDWRGRGVGRALFGRTSAFAREATYRKIVIQVRGTNAAAQRFYSRLGFVACGRLARQVVIDGVADDELLMEMHL